MNLTEWEPRMLHFPAPRTQPGRGQGPLRGKLKNRMISISFSLRKIARATENDQWECGAGPCEGWVPLLSCPGLCWGSWLCGAGIGSCVCCRLGAGSSLQTQGCSWVTQFGAWVTEPCTHVPASRQTEIPVFPSSLPVPGSSTAMGRGEVMGLEGKGKERWSRNAQARRNGKSVTGVLQSNAEPGVGAVVPLLVVVGWWCHPCCSCQGPWHYQGGAGGRWVLV